MGVVRIVPAFVIAIVMALVAVFVLSFVLSIVVLIVPPAMVIAVLTRRSDGHCCCQSREQNTR
jgi:uncharacterized protein YqhQ